jgi:hypothetical protein
MDLGAMKDQTVVSYVFGSILRMALCCALLLLPIPATVGGADDDPEQAVFSLDFKDKPLSQVLDQITRLTGTQLMVNKEYAELKVSGSLKDVTVIQGLREIMAEMNHTIIYEADQTISLVIYGKKQASGPGGTRPLSPPNYPMNLPAERNFNSFPEPSESAEEAQPEPDESGGGEAVEDSGDQPQPSEEVQPPSPVQLPEEAQPPEEEQPQEEEPVPEQDAEDNAQED